MHALTLPVRSTWRWCAARPYTVLAIVLLAGLSVYFLRHNDPEWENVFVHSATQLWTGAEIYDSSHGYLYPPFMAWATLPVLALPHHLQRVAWLVVNLIALVALLRCAWLLANGPALQSSDTPRSERIAAVVGVACAVSYLLNCWSHLQTDIVIASLQAVGCLLLLRGRDIGAAILFGLAAACKCTPLLWAPYLVWRGRPLAAGVVLLVALGANLLPDLVHSAPSGRLQLVEFGVRFLEPLTHRDHAIGAWGSDIGYNQSIAGAGQRWANTTWEWSSTECAIVARPGDVSPPLLRGIVYGTCLLMLALSVIACGAPGRWVDGERVAGGVPRMAVECGVILLLMLLLSPMSSRAHFGTLVIPAMCLARAARERGAAGLLGVLLALAVALSVLGNKDLVGGRVYTLMLWYATTTFETLILLVGCWFALWRSETVTSSLRGSPA
jgi:alpha-1,2-mannosyltransferase